MARRLGPQDDEEAVGAIKRALELGVNWIDRRRYGLGHSEELVARALKDVSERPSVFTKCSLVWDENAEDDNVLKKDFVKQECEDILRRLQVDIIDLYQIHWPNPTRTRSGGSKLLFGRTRRPCWGKFYETRTLYCSARGAPALGGSRICREPGM